jgi:hypothetical protein
MMVQNITDHVIDLEPTRENLARLYWSRDFFTAMLPTFRWTGLAGVKLNPQDVSILGLMEIFPPREKMITGFATVVVHNEKMDVPSIFSIPTCIYMKPEHQDRTTTVDAIEGIFRFKNDSMVVVKVLVKDLVFWKRVGMAMLDRSRLASNLIVDMLDPGFASRVCNAGNSVRESSVETRFLGGGDTTNIVVKFTVASTPGFDHVLKFYPRLVFNTARFLNDMLASANFHSYARLLATCDYPSNTLHKIFRDADEASYLERVKQACAPLNSSATTFFPFIQLTQLLHGDGDGGMPFWKSAITQLETNGGPSPEILGLATTMGRIIFEFHDALNKSPQVIGGTAETQNRSSISRIKDQVPRAHAFLQQYKTNVPESCMSLFEHISKSCDFTIFAKKIFLDETSLHAVPRQYIHQDLHMGQLMFADENKEFYVLDLEGDPQLDWRDRLSCYPVERDVASLIRSLSYIKIGALRSILERDFTNIKDKIPRFSELYPLMFLFPFMDVSPLLPGVDAATVERLQAIVKRFNYWETRIRATLLASYTEHRKISTKMLDFSTLQRTMNELSYEMKYRPANFFIALVGLLELVNM